MRPKYFGSTSKAPVLIARKSREVVCATAWLHKPHVTTSRPHVLTPRYSGHPTTKLLLISPTPEGWNPESSLSVPGIEPGPPAHKNLIATKKHKGSENVFIFIYLKF